MRHSIIVFSINVCLSFSVAVGAKYNSAPSSSMQVIEGEKQYRLIQSNANLPQYGRCWTEAIRQIDTTCNDLNEKTQARLALQFTKCFMAMSGGDVDVDADAQLTACNDVDCIGNMSERVFQAYTHFYTHTQNICFYLMNQVWHSETERTIQLLQTHSQSVSKQLELAGRLQINLLHQQREGLKVQRQLVEHGLNLSQVLNESQGSLGKLTEQFRNSTIEQGRQLGDLFQRLAQFHNWIVGEYTFIEQIMYYFILLVVIMIATTAKRSENCRFLLFILAVANLAVESILIRYLGADYFIEDIQIVVFQNLWLIRKVFAAIMLTVYIGITVTYIDSHRMTLNMLERVHAQNNEIIRMLKDMNMKPITSLGEQNGWIDDRNRVLRQSVERDRTMTPKPFNDYYPSVRTRNVSVIREQSVESAIESNGILTRSRFRRGTPLLSV